MIPDDEHIGPINGHYKSEALANGFKYLVIAFASFILLFGGIIPLIDYFCGGCAR